MSKIYDFFSSSFSSNDKLKKKEDKKDDKRDDKKDDKINKRKNELLNPNTIDRPRSYSNSASMMETPTNKRLSSQIGVSRSKSMIKLEINKDKNVEEIILNEEDKYKISYIEKQDLSRSNFSIRVISEIGWWPDEMLVYIEINRLIYINFMQPYLNNPSIFDNSLRNIMYFMNQKPYSKDDYINKFIKSGQTNIPDNYWLNIVNEDNCYMGEYEDRARSKNTEAKHFNLLKAVMKILEYKKIEYDGLTLKDEYITKLYIYVSIYLMKNMMAMIDEILRKLIISALENKLIEFHLPDIFISLVNDEIKNKILNYAKKSKDKDLLNSVYLLKDILLYASYSTIQFDHIFNGKKIFKNGYINKNSNLSPFSTDTNKKYIKYFKDNNIKRINCVYQIYVEKLAQKKNKDQLVLKSSDNFEILLKESSEVQRHISSPRYTNVKKGTRNISLINGKNYNINNILDYNMNPVFFVSDDDSKSTESQESLPEDRSMKKNRSTSVNDINIIRKHKKSSSAYNIS